MFHIILFILKIFGIVLLSIVGILLLLITLILFIPIRYRLDAENNDNVKIIAKISWLLSVLFCQITFMNHNFHIRLRILGKTFYDSDKPKEKVKKEVKKLSRKIEKKAEKQVKDVIEEKIMDSVKETHEDNTANHEEWINPKREEIVEEEQISIDNKEEADDSEYEEHKKTVHDHKQKKANRFKIIYQNIIAKIKQFLKKIRSLFISMKDTLLNMKEKIVEIKASWLLIKSFFHNETNLVAIKKTFVSLKKVLRHIRPTKVRIHMEFGTGDPCQTGQALGGIALLYGYYGEAIHVIPNFETEIYKGSLFLKGRIRLFTLLIISIKLLVNKNFKQFIKNVRTLKEEL